MTKETIRIMEDVRKLSPSEWEALKAALLTTKKKQKEVKKNTIEEKDVYELLKNLGVPSNVLGSRYLRRAIMLTIEEPEMLNGITKWLYPKIAKDFETTVSRAERAIRHAIEITWEHGNYEKIQEIFGWTISSEKSQATNSQFIAGIVDYLCCR